MRKELLELANRYIEKIRNRDHALEKEQKNLEQRLGQIKTERDKFEKNLLRSKNYDPDSGVCPVCWIDNGFSSEFKPIAGDNSLDKFRCSHCGLQLDVDVWN